MAGNRPESALSVRPSQFSCKITFCSISESTDDIISFKSLGDVALIIQRMIKRYSMAFAVSFYHGKMEIKQIVTLTVYNCIFKCVTIPIAHLFFKTLY